MRPTPPIRGINDDRPDAVRAIVISTNGHPNDKTSRTIAYLETCSVELKKQYEAAQSGGPPPPMGRSAAQNHRLVRRLSDTNWHSLASAKGKAQSIFCLNNLRQLGLGTHLYSDDHNDGLPPIQDLMPAGFETSWRSYLFKYVGQSAKTYDCPTEKTEVYASGKPARSKTASPWVIGQPVAGEHGLDALAICQRHPKLHDRRGTWRNLRGLPRRQGRPGPRTIHQRLRE